MGGSSIGLVLGSPTPLRLALAAFGIGGTLGLILTMWQLYLEIERLLDTLTED